MTIVLGLDIGGTKMAGLLANGQDDILAAAEAPTPTAGPTPLREGILALVDDLLRQAGLSRADLSGAGLGIPGRVDAATGAVATAVNLNLKHTPLGPDLARALGAPVAVENDVRAAAIGAYHHLFPDPPARSLAYLNLGTGVSAGVVLAGRLHRGRHGMAGEIGHVVVEPDGPLCNCGQRGCLETLIAGPAIARQAAGALGRPAGGKTADLYRAAAAGQPAAAAAVAEVSRRVAQTVQWLVMGYDVDRLVLGGGVTRLGPPFLDPIRAILDEWRASSPLMDTMLPPDLLALLPPDFNPGIWGAIHLARRANS